MKAAALLASGILWAGAALAQSPVTVTISTQSPGYTIPDDFSGLSFEMGSAVNNRNRYSRLSIFSDELPDGHTLSKHRGAQPAYRRRYPVDRKSNAVIPTHLPASSKCLLVLLRAVGNSENRIYSLQLPGRMAAARAMPPRRNSSGANYSASRFRRVRHRQRARLLNSYHYPRLTARGAIPAITSYTSITWPIGAKFCRRHHQRRARRAIRRAGHGRSLYRVDLSLGKSWDATFRRRREKFGHGGSDAITPALLRRRKPGKHRRNFVTGVISNLLSAGWVTTNCPRGSCIATISRRSSRTACRIADDRGQ